MVEVLTKPSCVACNQTKKRLDKLGVPYETIDMTEHPEALERAKNLGFMSAPVIITPTGEAWSGYRPEKLDLLAN